jgi:hypothetical protein
MRTRSGCGRHRDTLRAVADLPPLPETPVDRDLGTLPEPALDDAASALRDAERRTLALRAPYDRHLGEIRARLAQIATEQRRRERAAHVAQRAGVRQAARSGDMPSLQAALDGETRVAGETPLHALRWFLSSGGEVSLGFATRPGTLAFTDGRQQRQARTWGEAIELHLAGWDPGTPGIPGVRVHLAGSRVERVVPATDVVLEAPPA